MVIGHGRSTALSVKHGIRVAAEFHTSGVNQRIGGELRALGARKDPGGTVTKPVEAL